MAVANTEPSSRERILRAGVALMSQAGLSGVTLGMLADKVKISKSGLFAHFRSKEAVQIELLNYMSEFAAECVIRPSLLAAEGLPQLLALVRNWLGWAQRAGLPGGCPVAAGLFEFDDVEGAVRSKILEMESSFRGMLVALVLRAVELGHLRSDLDVEQFVWELCGIYLSHHAAHRFLRSADADQRAQTAFDALLARALPPRGKTCISDRASSSQTQIQSEEAPTMNHSEKPLEIGMLLYPGLTLLDLIGPHTVFSWYANIHLVWKTTDLVRTDTGIGVKPNATFATCPRELDILFVPGGFGQQNLMADSEVIAFLANTAALAPSSSGANSRA